MYVCINISTDSMHVYAHTADCFLDARIGSKRLQQHNRVRNNCARPEGASLHQVIMFTCVTQSRGVGTWEQPRM